MQRSGFVLAGGRSSRMGQDKALLPYRGTTLVEYVARVVEEAVGSVALVGDPARYSSLGYPVYRDKLPRCGPMGGILTALSVSSTDWNLIVACDMPGITRDALRVLADSAEGSGKICLIATGPGGDPEPLLGAYHRRCLPVLARRIREKQFKMKELVAELEAQTKLVDGRAVSNINTPAEWAEFEEHIK